MRFLGGALVALVVLPAVACSADGERDRGGGGPTPPTSSAPSARLLSETEACAEVREGIDAFNLGDLEQTVRHFQDAVPLAKDLVADDPTAGPLLEAIEYYAALSTEEFPEASPSPEFQRNKAITLTLCAYGPGPDEEPSETQVPA